MPFADVRGFRMAYEVHGTGFPLLLINGLGSDRGEWMAQIPAFGKRFRVIAFDNRGSGESEAPPGPYTTSEMADDAAAVLSFLLVPKAHVLGVSLGGMIAQEIALRHPARVERLVLACTSPGGEASVRPSPGVLAAFTRVPGGDREAELRRTIPFLYTDRYRTEHPEEIEAFIARRLAAPSSPEGYAAQLAAAVGHSAGDRLKGIRSPALVIAGTADLIVPPVNSERIALRIPGSKLVSIPGAPHRLFAENAGAFNREVLAFLTRDRP